jgi:hypothetical protein
MCFYTCYVTLNVVSILKTILDVELGSNQLHVHYNMLPTKPVLAKYNKVYTNLRRYYIYSTWMLWNQFMPPTIFTTSTR